MSLSTTRHGAGLAVATLVLTGVTGATATTTAPSAEAPPGTIRVITHNLQKKVSAVDAAFKEARATSGPEVILLQEVCEGMVKGIQDRMGHAVYRERKASNTNCGGSGIGEMAVWTGGGLNGKSKHDLGTQQAGSHLYGLACVTFSYPGRNTRACSTHLAAGDSSFDPIRQSKVDARSSGGSEHVCKSCTPSDHRMLWGSLPLKVRS